MPTITNYGDVVTTGNTTSQGTGSSTFAGSLGCTNLTATNASVAGNVSVTQFLGIGGFTPVSGGPTIGVTGNVYASNALITTNVFSNTLTVLNAVSIAGNIYASNALNTTNVVATGNVTVAQFLSAGGFALALGNPTVGVTGNIYASNALNTTNVFATGNVTAAQFLGVGGFAVTSGNPTVGVTGNIYASNAVQVTNVTAAQFISVGGFALAGGNPTIGVTGNVYASNAVQTSTLYATNIYDQAGSSGTTGQLLSKGASGTAWTTLSTNPLSGTVTTSAVTYAATSSTIQTAPGIVITNPTASGATVVLTCSGDIVAYSDRNIKTNIEPISDALSKVSRIGGYTFTRTDGGAERRTGVIAQEVQEVLPEAVYITENGTLTVAYGNMVGLLIEAIKDLKTRITELENKFQP